MLREKDLWQHSGETEQLHHQMGRTSELVILVVMLGRLTRNMGKSLDASFIHIYQINTVRFTPAYEVA